ncbi:MAG: M15 family metallopeptidase [Pseudomonadota bacterium]
MALGMEKLENLELLFREKVKRVIDNMERQNWSIRVIWGKRTEEENLLLVQQGVASRESKHLDGRAVDLIDRKIGYVHDRTHPFYRDLEKFAKEQGLKWGGDFSGRWDPCHIEMP